LAAGQSLKFASCQGGWGVRSWPRNTMAIHSVAVDRIPNLPIERQTLHHWAMTVGQWWFIETVKQWSVKIVRTVNRTAVL